MVFDSNGTRNLSERDPLFAALAVRSGGRFSRGRHSSWWFEGFWDFVVRERPGIDARPSSAVSGVNDRLPWLLLCREAPESNRASDELCLDLFVEVEMQAGDVTLWSTTSIRLSDGGFVEPDLMVSRPHDLCVVEALRRLGFEAEVGFWGVRAIAVNPSAALDSGANFLNDVVGSTLKLARSVGIAERQLV